MIDQLYPVLPAGISSSASPRRLSAPWRWVTRIVWIAVFALMLYLNVAAIMAHVERNASGASGGAVGLRAAVDNAGAWVLTVDPLGPGAQAGLQSGDRIVAVDGVALSPNASFREVNRAFFGSIGTARTFTVARNASGTTGGTVEDSTVEDSTVEDVTLTLVEEDLLKIWRRFRVPLGLTEAYYPTLEAILLGVYLLISALIFWKRSDDWLALYLTLTLVLITPQMSYSWYYLSHTAAHWEDTFRLLLAVAVALTLPNFYLMPNGVFVPRWAFILTIVWIVWSVGTELLPDAPFSIYRTSGATQLAVWLAWFATGFLAQIYRYRYAATPTEQQQIKWVSFGLTVAVVVNLGWMLTFELLPVLNHQGPAHDWMWRIGRTVYVLGMMVLPVSFGIAVFRYRLWQIDNLINRTLVYGTLTVVVVGIYVLVVMIFDAFFGEDGQFFSQLVAITLDLIIFAPLREQLQVTVDGWMFGESDDLPTVAARLGQRLGAASGPDEVLPTIVATLAESLHLPYVAVTLPDGDGFRIAAESGAPISIYFTWPLVYQRQSVGQLRLAPRVAGESFKPDEWQIIASVAYHVSAAVHDLLLEQELRSRQA